jgi:enterochelin esterase-like enzyme
MTVARGRLLRKFCAAIVLVAAALMVCPVVFASEIRQEAVASPNLGRDFPYLIYLPDGFDVSRRYPVLYLLHGAGGDQNTWVQRGMIQAKVDKLIAAGTIPPALIVMPGCPECWWVDGGKDKTETAFWSDLVPAVAQRYPTIENRSGLLMAGVSAGGYGAVRFALKYPGRVGAIAAFSPAIYADTPPPDSAARRQPPFQGADGQFSQTAWAEHNYPRLLTTYFSQSTRVPVFLVSGDNDRLGIAFETALLFKRLFDKQPDQVELRIVDGDHSWAVWSNAADEAFAFLFRAAKPALTTNSMHGTMP